MTVNRPRSRRGSGHDRRAYVTCRSSPSSRRFVKKCDHCGACCAIAWRPLPRPVRGRAGPAWVCSKVETLTANVAHSVRQGAFSDCRGVWAGGTCPWRPGRGGANGTGPAGIPGRLDVFLDATTDDLADVVGDGTYVQLGFDLRGTAGVHVSTETVEHLREHRFHDRTPTFVQGRVRGFGQTRGHQVPGFRGGCGVIGAAPGLAAFFLHRDQQPMPGT